eukprot:6181555-Pleurochrysis_carterae.AAC.3
MSAEDAHLGGCFSVRKDRTTSVIPCRGHNCAACAAASAALAGLLRNYLIGAHGTHAAPRRRAPAAHRVSAALYSLGREFFALFAFSFSATSPREVANSLADSQDILQILVPHRRQGGA